MNFTHTTGSGGMVFTLSGAFTFQDHHSFRGLLDIMKRCGRGRHVLDISQLEFLDSAALGMLLVANDEADSSGSSIVLSKPPQAIARLFELAAMDTVFKIEP